VKHARATQVRVVVGTTGGASPRGARQLTVVVEDNGAGPTTPNPRDIDGHHDRHFGLGLLAGLLDERGGSISLTRDETTGWTRLHARMPMQESARV
jgi:two-component sensor histidine kinase